MKYSSLIGLIVTFPIFLFAGCKKKNDTRPDNPPANNPGAGENTFHYDNTRLKGHSSRDLGIACKNEPDGKCHPPVNGSVDTIKHTISIKTTHSYEGRE